MRAKHFVDFINQGAELDKITYEEYQRKLLDETLTDEESIRKMNTKKENWQAEKFRPTYSGGRTHGKT
jgi:hypothetical protein